jgi:DNA-directed RNA polymerase specialized sigma24 family protein
MIYVNKFVKDEDLSKDIAQEVLIKIWDALESGKYQEN